MIQPVTSKNKGIRKRDQLELWAETQHVIQKLGPWYLGFVAVSLSLSVNHTRRKAEWIIRPQAKPGSGSPTFPGS